MSIAEKFPDDVQDSIFRMFDVISAFVEDIDSANPRGFLNLTNSSRFPDVRKLLDYGILIKRDSDGDYGLGPRGQEAYNLIFEDILKPDADSKIRRLYRSNGDA